MRVDLGRVGGDFKFTITNWGRVPARDVTFDLDIEVGKCSPLIKGEYDEKIYRFLNSLLETESRFGLQSHLEWV